MIGKKELREFADINGNGFPVTTFLLKISPADWDKREFVIRAKDLVKDARREIEKKGFDKQALNSARQDFEKIIEFLNDVFQKSGNEKGILIVASSGSGLFRSVPLTFSTGDRLYVENAPVLGDIVLGMSERRRFMTVLADRERGRFFHVSGGEVEELTPLTDDTPKKVRGHGFEEKKIEGHFRDALRRHLKNVCARVDDLSKTLSFDSVLLGGSPEITGELTKLFSAGMVKKLSGSFHAEVKTCDASSVLAETRKLEGVIGKRDSDAHVEALYNSLRAGMAVAGLANTINVMNRDELHSIVLTRSQPRRGRVCEKCSKIYEDQPVCVSCGQETSPTSDLFEAMIRISIKKGILLECLPPGSSLEKWGGVAGILKFKT